MLKPQQLTRRRNDLERAVRGAMGRALIRTGKELGEEYDVLTIKIKQITEHISLMVNDVRRNMGA